jgi:hypothetical protein
LNVVFGQRRVSVYVVAGGLILMQPSSSRCRQYHQLLELSVDASHANEMLVSVVAVIRWPASSVPIDREAPTPCDVHRYGGENQGECGRETPTAEMTARTDTGSS